MKKLKTTKNICLAVTALVIVAGIVVFLMFGLAPSKQFDGEKRYTSAIASAEFNPETFDMKKLSADIGATLDKEAAVTFSMNYSTGAYELAISVSPMSYELKTEPVLAMLGEKYADLGIKEFTVQTLNPSSTMSSIVVFAIVLLLAWITALAVTSVTLGFKTGLSAFASAVLCSLAVFSVFVLGRLQNFTILAGAVVTAVAVSLYFGIQKITELERQYQKQNSKDASVAVKNAFSAEKLLGSLVISVVTAAAFIAASLSIGISSLISLGIIIPVAVLTALFLTNCVVAGMWASSQK
ncbi:MAG: hypothetical protein RSD08_01835 [Oscillospiraceae bacterium]